MKISPIQQQAFSKRPTVYKPSKKTVDRITVGCGIMISSIILGCGYMIKDRDFYESRAAIKQHKIVNMSFDNLDNFMEKFNIENLQINPIENDKYSYSAKTGNFETVSGTFSKDNENSKIINGTLIQNGLFKKKEYSFSLKHLTPSKNSPTEKLEIAYAPISEPNNKTELSIVEYKDSKEIFINGKKLKPQEQKDAETFAALFFLITVGSLYYMAKDEIKEEEQ